ncbi:Clp protease/crotonase-like domain-containing protein [Flindersiella endophytica]
MSDETNEVLVERAGAVLRLTFNRPERRNAMTWAMYDGLVAACEQADSDPEIRVLVLTGAGGQAFVAGTDIDQFLEFETGADGVAYEEKMAAILDRLARVRVPVVAVIQGFCVGAGLAIASVCDLRIAGRSARFGIPIARTVGNCLSMTVYSLLVSHFGPGRTLDLLLRARLLSAEEADDAGFLTGLCADDEVEAKAAETVERLLGHAPLSMWAAKEAVRRLRTTVLPDGADIVEAVYGSDDFKAGVRAFVGKQRAEWTGG